MKTYLNLGAAWRNGDGALCVTIQLMRKGAFLAIADAHFVGGKQDRVIFSRRAAKLSDEARAGFVRDALECAQPNSVKTLTFAYPTSDTAIAHGYGSTGCYCVKLGLPGKPLHVVRTFDIHSRTEGEELAKSLPFTWDYADRMVHADHVETV